MLNIVEMESQTKINANMEVVWEVFTDIKNWTNWSPTTLEVWDVSENIWELSSKFSFRLKMAGVGVPFTVDVCKSIEKNTIAWKSTIFTVTAVRTYTFEEIENAVLVKDHKQFKSSIFPIWLFYPRPIIRSMTERWLKEFKLECEKRSNIN